MDPLSPTFDVIGFLGSDLGLTVAARNSIRVLEATGRMGEQVTAGLPSRGYLLERLQRWIRPRAASRAVQREYDRVATPGHVNLFQINPLEIAVFLPDWRDTAVRSVRNVCVPFWELPVAPRAWGPVLGAMDAVMVPSRFVQAACAGLIDPGRVVHYPQAVFLPDGVRPARHDWGLDAYGTVFALAFDLRSDIDRKNPWAAIEAFRAAFPGDEQVALVIKTTGLGDATFSAHAEQLRARIASDRRIRLVERSLGYPEVLGLYASCDVLLSLHRSEGLGLHLMEAMSLGKAVVATNWSGNTDFMTEANSVPIGFQLVPIRTTHPVYRREAGRPGQAWADADVREAARALRRLHADPGHREAIGLAASRDMEVRRREVLSGEAFDRLESTLRAFPGRGRALSLAALRTLGIIAFQELLQRGTPRGAKP